MATGSKGKSGISVWEIMVKNVIISTSCFKNGLKFDIHMGSFTCIHEFPQI